MALKGDFSSLKQLVGRFRVLSRQGARRVTKQFAAETEELVHRCFERSEDIYGRRWARLKYRKGEPLQDTRRLESSINTRLTSPTSYRVQTNVPYAAIHNFGGTIRFGARSELRRYSAGRRRRRVDLYSRSTRSVRTVASYGGYAVTIPKRQFLPAPGQLPPKWERHLRRHANVVMESLWGDGGAR